MNIIFKKVIITLIFSSFIAASVPNVIIKVNRDRLKQGENLKVTIWTLSKKDSNVIFPKISKIMGYKIKEKREYKSFKTVTINKKREKLQIKSINYIIRPSHSLTIAPLTVLIDHKQYKTKSKKVYVEQPKKKSNSSGFVLKIYSNKTKVVEGESFIVYIELIEPIDFSGADVDYSPPNFDGFRVAPIGETKVTQINSKIIKKKQYLVTAIKSGKFIIKPAKAKIGIQSTLEVQSPFAFFGADIQWQNLSSNPLTITVLNKPSTADIIGNYKLTSNVDNNKIKSGKPINYILTIEGEGDLSNIEDPIIDINSVTVYNNDASIIHNLKNGKLYSKYSKTYIFIATDNFTIPQITINAYNSKNKKVYTLVAKPIKVKVKKSQTISSLLNGTSNSIKTNRDKAVVKNSNSNKAVTIKAKESSKIETILFDKEYYRHKYSHNLYTDRLKYLIYGILLGVFASIFLQKLFKKILFKEQKEQLYSSYKEALHILYPYTNKDIKIEDMVKLLYEAINGNKEIKIDDNELRIMINRVKSL